MGKLEDVAALYESRPYPPINLFSALFSRVRRDDLLLLNYQAGYASCAGSLEGAPLRPKILVAGCGTFEAVVVAMANPGADILAVDLSQNSLHRLKRQALLHGVGNRIRFLRADLEALSEGDFDYVIATGVLHHLEDPLRALMALKKATKPAGIFRFMIYSRWGRDLLYGAKNLAQTMEIQDPKKFRKWIESFPADHPYRIYFHIYSDAKTDDGLADGYLHPLDQPFDALSLKGLLQKSGMEARFFLHKPEGQPSNANLFSPFSPDQGNWERLAVLELLGVLQENFCFFSCAESLKKKSEGRFVWNPLLLRRGRFFSKISGEFLSFDPRLDPNDLSEREIQLYEKSLFILRGGSS